MPQTRRREFLKAALGTALTASSPWALATTRVLAQDSPPKPKARVAAVRGEKLSAMARDAIDALGGIAKIVEKGETVFIKPNFVTFPWAQYNNCFRIGECTKPEIVIAVTEECLKAGAREVIIGEGSHAPRFEWKHAVTLDGSTDLVTEAARLSSRYAAKVRLACLETDSPRWIEVPSKTSHGKIAVSSLAVLADKVISIPVAKTHSFAQLTLAAKNFLGVTPISRYAGRFPGTTSIRIAFDHSSPETIAQVYLDIVKALKPALSIVDFSIGLEADGPSKGQGGTTVDVKQRLGAWAIFASTDIMAADATAARIMSHDPAQVKQLTMGFEMGLGEIRAEKIELLGEKLADLRMPWKPATLKGRKAQERAD